MRKARKEITIEETNEYRIYRIDDDYFVDFFNNAPICWGYSTLQGAKEAIYHYFN